MQVMGQTARETGVNSLHLSTLCDPAVGLATGCKILRKKLDAAGGDVHKALQAWNGGANPDYANEVEARVERYR
jgi:soluble lytic murein transglycosylase-like protein